MAVSSRVLGSTEQGGLVTLYTMKNQNGYEAEVCNLGAIWTRMCVPDRNGVFADVLLGYDTTEGLSALSGEMGAIVGRNANRIKDGKFTLNGKNYQLAQNNGPNNLHSGPDKFSKRFYETEVRTADGGDEVWMRLASPEGDQGYPGSLLAEICYRLTDDNAFVIEYRLTAGDADTLCNLTSHPYFNLAGHKSGSALSQEVWIDADFFCESDQNTCPTGRLLPVEHTPFDFRRRKALRQEIGADAEQLRFCGGYDHNFCLRHARGKRALSAAAYDPESGRYLEVYTDRPGLQLYTGNFLDPAVTGKDGAHYHPHDGYAFETQYYPNAINVAEWEQPVIRAHTVQETVTVYQFGSEAGR